MIPLQRSSTGCPRQCHGLKNLEKLDGKCCGAVDSSSINPGTSVFLLRAISFGCILQRLVSDVCHIVSYSLSHNNDLHLIF